MSTLAPIPTLEMLDSIEDGKLYELVHGELVEKEMSNRASLVAGKIGRLLGNFVDPRRVGAVYPEALIACFPDPTSHARRPDVLYISAARHALDAPDAAAIPAAPELCVEVVSTPDEILGLDEKIQEYFEAGVQVVWVVNPALKTVLVQHPDGTARRLTAKDTISLPDILPGFEAQVADFF